jgi:hypothetical protein
MDNNNQADRKQAQETRRLRREKKTLRAMLNISCRAKHGTKTALCAQCQALLAYAEERIDKCPFFPEKPTCAKCPVHCYQPARREEMRQVMRYAGPRMLLRHPLLTLLHSLDEARIQPPALPRRRRPQTALHDENRRKQNSDGSGIAYKR